MLGRARLVVDIEQSTNAKYDIYIDGVNVKDYCFIKADSEYGCKDIQIKIYDGAIKINEYASKAYYPCLDGSVKIVSQIEYIDWFFSDTHVPNCWYYKGDTIMFKHLYPQGPSYFVDGKPIFKYNEVLPAMKDNKSMVTQQVINYIEGQYDSV